MPRHRRDIPPDEVNRLTRIRGNAQKATERAEQVKAAGLLAMMPDPADDILGALAWAETAFGADHPTVMDLVDRALGERLEWREIAAAFGIDPGDEARVGNVAQAHRRRRNKQV